MKRSAKAPYRILDCGGWTDTSFMPGGKGACCNVAIMLGVHVEFTPDNSNSLQILHKTGNKKETIPLPITQSKPHTLAEAAVLALQLSQTDGGTVTVSSDVPPGSSLGGSATYAVALIAVLAPEKASDPHKVAALAQELETKWLGQSCGTQDQMAAAYGGISFSEITYPDFTHEAIEPPADFLRWFSDSLLLVYTGESHFSSEMHHTVIAELERGDQNVVLAFRTLHECGRKSAEAIKAGDIQAYQDVVNENWQAQKSLHKNITTPLIESLHELVLNHDAEAAFKGSGAGGGGSVAILVAPESRGRLVQAIRQKFPTMQIWDNLKIDNEGISLGG
jgi:D-glycero-alpha-D-manno-heptose-7-phosphate kinase